jgi:MerR family transcriptional regulator, thiopeptide resistance regulator
MFITEIARRFGLSRSTLLYYDRIGLLTPSGRSESGYRMYSSKDQEALAAICSFRQAGLTIEDIRRILSLKNVDADVLKRRIHGLGEEIQTLKTQQHLLGKMLQVQSLGELPVSIDKQAWIEMLQAAGMDDAAMSRWHREFERRSPEAHHWFLIELGVSENEALLIRRNSRDELKDEGT